MVRDKTGRRVPQLLTLRSLLTHPIAGAIGQIVLLGPRFRQNIGIQPLIRRILDKRLILPPFFIAFGMTHRRFGKVGSIQSYFRARVEEERQCPLFLRNLKLVQIRKQVRIHHQVRRIEPEPDRMYHGRKAFLAREQKRLSVIPCFGGNNFDFDTLRRRQREAC